MCSAYIASVIRLALCSPIDLPATLVIVLLECASSVQIRFVQLSVRFYENPVPSQLVTEKWSFRLPPEFLELLLRGVELHVRNLVADDDEHDSLVECRLFYCGSLYLLRVGEHAACRKSCCGGACQKRFPRELALTKRCSDIARSQHTTGACASLPSSICIAERAAGCSVRRGAMGAVECSITGRVAKWRISSDSADRCWARKL